MQGQIEFCGVTAKLWSQEAAGWAQAVFSVVAIAVTYCLASRSSREESRRRKIERSQHAKALSLALLPALTKWYGQLQWLTAKGDYNLVDAMKGNSLQKESRAPEEIFASMKDLHLLGDTGQSIEIAVFLQAWLMDNQVRAFEAARGNSGDSVKDELEWKAYLAKVDRLVAEVRSAKDAIRDMFEKDLNK